eukprot:CFRG3395T1
MASATTVVAIPRKPNALPRPVQMHVTLPLETLKDRDIIVVGDIHGCFDELQSLLSKCEYSPSTHLVINVGDMVNKGPKSVEVLNWFYDNRDNGVYTVRGNHDDSMLLTMQQSETEGAASANIKPHYDYIKEIKPEVRSWALDIPYTIAIGDLLIVHAGLVPKEPLEQQTPFDMTRMRVVRKLDDESYEPLQRVSDGAVQWATTWPGPQLVIFGHDAKKQLQEEPFALGLDTGCCYGKMLTCAIFKTPNIAELPREDWYKLKNVAALAEYEKPGAKPPPGNDPTETRTADTAVIQQPGSCTLL